MHVWRPLTPADVPSVSAVAALVHPDYFEDDAVFAERIGLASSGCWLCEGADGVAGYVLSHPYRLGRIPALNAPLGALPPGPDTYYVHDLALVPNARGTGAARAIVEKLIDIARPYPTMSLVAVNASAPFWSRFGFRQAERPELRDKLASYDASASWMVRPR